MKPALVLFFLLVLALEALAQGVGFSFAYTLGLGLFLVLALIIALVFLWLWKMRDTPLALGIGVAWSGGALMIGWALVFNLAGGPDWMVENHALFVILAVYLSGALMHFRVIGAAFGLGAPRPWVVVFLAGLACAGVSLLIL